MCFVDFKSYGSCSDEDECKKTLKATGDKSFVEDKSPTRQLKSEGTGLSFLAFVYAYVVGYIFTFAFVVAFVRVFALSLNRLALNRKCGAVHGRCTILLVSNV
jgi:hypothetical protein